MCQSLQSRSQAQEAGGGQAGPRRPGSAWLRLVSSDHNIEWEAPGLRWSPHWPRSVSSCPQCWPHIVMLWWHHDQVPRPPPLMASGAPSVVTALAACYWSQHGPGVWARCVLVCGHVCCHSLSVSCLLSKPSAVQWPGQQDTVSVASVMVRGVSDINRWTGIWTTAAMSSLPTIWFDVTAANKVLSISISVKECCCYPPPVPRLQPFCRWPRLID